MKPNAKRTARQQFFKVEFDKLATDGFIGDPAGQTAYAYVRVSSDEQGEEGRSGLPRQLQHCHETAKKMGYKICWELVFADDYSGFELERPELDALRKEYKQRERRASAIVIENLDRLSRNADWHQGFLLEEMRTFDISYLFWKPLGSRIERAVQGAVAQEGMVQAKERMRDGLRHKQEDGRITAKSPALGYKFVDDYGQENTPRVSRMTYYAIDPDRRLPVDYIFDQLAYHGGTARSLVDALDEKAAADARYRPPRAKLWSDRTISQIVRSELYKGEFVSNRLCRETKIITLPSGETKRVVKDYRRPQDEWIVTKVPAIVDCETWELANRNLWSNKRTASRNAKNEYLLASVVRCDTCGLRYKGVMLRPSGRTKHTRFRYYCGKNYVSKAERRDKPCGQPSIDLAKLDDAVWRVIVESLLNPDVINAAIERKYSGEDIQAVWDQIAFLDSQINGKATEEEKLRRAYLADAFSADEFAAERRRLVREHSTLTAERNRLKAQLMTPDELDAKKQSILNMLRDVRNADLVNAPFALRRKLVRLLVDEVILNTREGWFKIDGAVQAEVLFDSMLGCIMSRGLRTNRGIISI